MLSHPHCTFQTKRKTMNHINENDLPLVPYLNTLIQMLDVEDQIGKKFHILLRKCIPDCQSVSNINLDEWKHWVKQMEQNYEWQKEERIIWSEQRNYQITVEYFYCIHLRAGITLTFSSISNTGTLCYDKDSKVTVLDDLKAELETLKNPEPKCTIGFLHLVNGHLRVNFQEFKPYSKDLTSFHGEEYSTFKEEMIDVINDEEESGLFLLHGEPGTGKTSFIKSVLSSVDKKAIYLTPGFANSLTSPELLPLLMEYPNSVLVIEDAETVLMKREADNSNAVSNLLNLTDGFPSDFLKLKVICTFNSSIHTIDDALLREGRLKGMMEFKRLSSEKAKRLAQELGKEINTEERLTLAQVCNTSIRTSRKAKVVGF